MREVWVAQALIKARVQGGTEPTYLVQRDGKVMDEYRLIGGRRESGDRDLLETMKREMREELGIEYEKDYMLYELIHELPVSARVSPTYGVLSSYHYCLFGAKMTRWIRPTIGDNIWVTRRELLAGQTDSGEKIAAWHVRAIDILLPGGLDGVALSFPEESVPTTFPR